MELHKEFYIIAWTMSSENKIVPNFDNGNMVDFFKLFKFIINLIYLTGTYSK